MQVRDTFLIGGMRSTHNTCKPAGSGGHMVKEMFTPAG